MASVPTINTVKSGALTLKLGTICAAWGKRRELGICHFRVAKLGHAMHCNCCNGQDETRGTMLPAANNVLSFPRELFTPRNTGMAGDTLLYHEKQVHDHPTSSSISRS